MLKFTIFCFSSLSYSSANISFLIILNISDILHFWPSGLLWYIVSLVLIINMLIWYEYCFFPEIPKIFSLSEILIFLSMCSLNHNSTCLQRFAVSGHSSKACTVVSICFLQYKHSFEFKIFILCSNCLVFSLSCNILNCTYLLYTHLGDFCVILKAFWIYRPQRCHHLTFVPIFLLELVWYYQTWFE